MYAILQFCILTFTQPRTGHIMSIYNLNHSFYNEIERKLKYLVKIIEFQKRQRVFIISLRVYIFAHTWLHLATRGNI